MEETRRLELIAEAVRYCQRVKELGMPSSCYSKALREPVHFLWERRLGSKIRAPKFRSDAAKGLKFGRGLLICDHAIPFNRLQAELLALQQVTISSVRDALDRFDTIVLITKDENERLNAAGYKNKMPKDWDGIDPLARYKAVGIKLIENSSS